MNITNADKTVVDTVDSFTIVGNECRICLEKCNQVWEIFHPTVQDIPRKLMAFAAVQVEEGDGLPTTICHNCCRLLDVSYDFKCQVEKSDVKLREMLMLKSNTEVDEKLLSLSVNAAITEVIADGMGQDSGTKLEQECKDLVGSMSDETGHHIVDQLDQHHYVTDHDRIIFRIEPPSDQCSLEQTIAHEMKNEICEVNEKQQHLAINDCDDNGVVDVLIEKYGELVNPDGIAEVDSSFKMDRTMMSESDTTSDDDNNEETSADVMNVMENDDIAANEMVDYDTATDNDKAGSNTRKHRKDENEDEEKGGGAATRARRQKCPHCVKTFATKKSLGRHIERHEKASNLRYVCYMCDQQFSSIEKLKDHISDNHDKARNENKIGDDTNPEDATTERTERQLVRSSSKRNMKFSCEVCGKQFTYQKSFLTHAKSHPGYEPETVVEKDDCAVTTEEPSRKPESDDDDLPVEGLQCTQCGKLLATKRNLKRHVTTHSGLKFHCTTCSKEFSRIDKLKEHEQSKHKEEDFFASSDSDLDDENKNHDRNEGKKKEKHNRLHKCPMCPKAFVQEQSLTNHMERHKCVKDTQKRFLCEICSKCFAQRGTLVAHMRTHTGVKPYVCNVCSRAFTKSTYLQLHLRTHSGEKPYICQYCSRAFARANTLVRHITMHTGEAKYHCQICRKSFRRLTSLNEHTYTHTGQRPYACKTCTKRYNNAGSLYAHTKKCKPQQTSGTSIVTSYPSLPPTDEIHQNGATDPAASQMMLYSQRKLTENAPAPVEQMTESSPFEIVFWSE